MALRIVLKVLYALYEVVWWKMKGTYEGVLKEGKDVCGVVLKEVEGIDEVVW